MASPEALAAVASAITTLEIQRIKEPEAGFSGSARTGFKRMQEFIRIAAPPPDWLQKAWSGAKRRGLDTLTPVDIEAEITAHRRK